MHSIRFFQPPLSTLRSIHLAVSLPACRHSMVLPSFAWKVVLG